jgi:two-component system sensor histidine kinase LytS
MELRALQAQINPHFLFNTINTIASLVRTDPARARELLRGFATFYRRTLEEAEDMVPLHRELEFVNTYVALEKARFGDLLDVVEELDDGLDELCVPAFVLQPLVENAVVHGMRPGVPLRIVIRSQCNGDGSATVTVSDNGAGIDPERLPHVLEAGYGTGLGIALKNVHDRIVGRFGPGSGLKVESARDEWTRVSVVMKRACAT